jgi:hypothetical protein
MKPEPAEGFKHLPPSRHLVRYASKFGFAALETANCRKKEARQPLYGASQRLSEYKKKPDIPSIMKQMCGCVPIGNLSWQGGWYSKKDLITD